MFPSDEEREQIHAAIRHIGSAVKILTEVKSRNPAIGMYLDAYDLKKGQRELEAVFGVPKPVEAKADDYKG